MRRRWPPSPPGAGPTTMGRVRARSLADVGLLAGVAAAGGAARSSTATVAGCCRPGTLLPHEGQNFDRSLIALPQYGQNFCIRQWPVVSGQSSVASRVIAAG